MSEHEQGDGYNVLRHIRQQIEHWRKLNPNTEMRWEEPLLSEIDRLGAIKRQVKELVCQHEAAALSNRESAEQCAVSDEIKHRWLGMAEAQETGARLLRAIIDAPDAEEQE